ncbi:energy-coupling factor transporter ATPase [Bacillaceae bacterium S4-13-56]
MEILSANNISFRYPEVKDKAISDLSFSIQKGEFVVLCGPTGSGKSTLLRLLKQEIAPHGVRQGSFFFNGEAMENIDQEFLIKEIGLVFQDPENQITMDHVMEELVFGMENLGMSTSYMRKKVAELVHFFGLNHLLEKKTSELSGGQKQLINLVAVLLLEPSVLLLDEPTSQLDPIASKEFIHILQRLNREFGMTILIAEHRLEELFEVADRVIMLDKGELKHDTTPRAFVQKISSHSVFRQYLPNSALLFLDSMPDTNGGEVPLNVNEARKWLSAQEIEILPKDLMEKENTEKKNHILQLKEVDYSYSKYTVPVLRNLSLSVHEGEWLTIVGANGTGKSTLLKVISGLLKPQHGSVRIYGQKIKKANSKGIHYLPQNPKLFFLQDTLRKEFDLLAHRHQLGNPDQKIDDLLEEFQLTHLQDRHPYDLSGGELQKAALLGALVIQPSILLIDEPTKGLDPESKRTYGDLIASQVAKGVTVVMVTHDTEFAALYSTRCSMLFQGSITSLEATREFFSENTYYTTVINRITRNSPVPSALTLEEAKRLWRIKSI